MKKISVELLCDPVYTADCLRELANNIESDDFKEGDWDLADGIELNGDHYVAEIKEIEC